MEYTYDLYYWNVRTHRRTGKILSQRWSNWGCYDSEEEALEDLAKDRLEWPDLKFKLVKMASKELFNEVPNCVEYIKAARN